MKVSLKWAQYYSNVNLAGIGSDKLIEKIGVQLGEVEEVTRLGHKYEGIVVVSIVKCQPHDNANKLNVCLIDDGGKVANVERDTNGHIQVVCGAPNAHAGMLAAWIPPGVTVPSTLDKDPLIIKSLDIRGQTSHGMLASLNELGISDDHAGILEINPQDVGEELAKPGAPFKQLYNLDDIIVDIENKMFTHRPDCFGILGVTRELAGIQNLSFKSPDWYFNDPQPATVESRSITLDVKVEDYKLVPRFMAVSIYDIKVQSSPVWLQSYLSRVGVRPINNVVDLTNYFMLLTGQPLHAYDADKLMVVSKQSSLSLEARLSRPGEKINLLGGKLLELKDDSTILITSHDVPVGIGGVMGGADTEVDANTKNIVLECANFDMYNIRKTAMQYGLFTDAVTRFMKGQSALQNNRVLAHLVSDIERFAGGKVASNVVDIHGELAQLKPVKVSATFINKRLGEKLTAVEIAKLLTNVEFAVRVDGDELSVTAPFWRTDIEIPEDIVEEVGRLYGYDHLPLVLPTRSIKTTEQNTLLTLKSLLRDVLSSAGANEVLTYSFVHGGLLEKVGQNRDHAFQLSNALSPDLQYYRLSLLPSLLEKVRANLKAGYGELAMFEMNPVHAKDFVDKDTGLPREDHRLAFVFAADDKLAKQKYQGVAYYQAKEYLTDMLAKLGITDLKFLPADKHEPTASISQAVIAPFEKKHSAIVQTTKGDFIGELGEFRTAVRTNLKLPKFVAGFELDLMQLLKLQASQSTYTALPRFPKVEQDISLKMPLELGYGVLFDYLKQSIQTPDKTTSWFAPVDIYIGEQDKTHKHITLRLSIASYERTLTSEEVNSMLDKVAELAKAKFGVERI